MIALNRDDVAEVTVEFANYKGKPQPVTGVRVRWLSKGQQDEGGAPGYGLRLFVVDAGGEIPIHDHAYIQTMYILTGQFECWQFDPATDGLIGKKVCGPGDVIYVPSMEPHGMRNISPTEGGSFLCCICTPQEDVSYGPCA